MSDFLSSVGGFNPTQMSLSEIQNMKIPGMGEPLNLMQGPTGMYGNTSVPMDSSLVQGAVQGAIAKPEQGMSNSDMMQLAGMAMKGFANQRQPPIPLRWLSTKPTAANGSSIA
jgi:hypothetical protein